VEHGGQTRQDRAELAPKYCPHGPPSLFTIHVAFGSIMFHMGENEKLFLLPLKE
jgi:hypothetical protein